MTHPSFAEGSVVLRLEFSIADAVHQRGLFPVLSAAISAWWNQPKVPADLPDRLRADIGMPEIGRAAHFTEVRYTGVPLPLWRPGM